MNPIAFVLITLCSVWTLLGFVTVLLTARRTRRRSIVPGTARPPISVLKPLCGADAGLEATSRASSARITPTSSSCSACRSPTTRPSEWWRGSSARFPEVRVKLVVHPGARAINPKVDNLLGMLPQAALDLVLISDSNVRAPSHYLGEMVETLERRAKNGLVTNLFAGTGEDGLGSALENVQLNGFCAGGRRVAHVARRRAGGREDPCCSRGTFESLGGFRRVADVLAEDYVMGKMFQHGGYRVRIAPTVLDNVTRGMTVKGFCNRQLRWAMLRSRLRPAAQLLEVLSSPLACCHWRCLMGPTAALTWTFTLLALRDVGGWVALRGWRKGLSGSHLALVGGGGVGCGPRRGRAFISATVLV